MLAGCSAPMTTSDAGSDDVDGALAFELDAGLAEPEPDASTELDAGKLGRWTWAVSAEDIRFESSGALTLGGLRFRCGWDGPGSPLPIGSEDRIDVGVSFIVDGAQVSGAPWDGSECDAGDGPNWTLTTAMFECGQSLEIAFNTALVRRDTGARALVQRVVVPFETAGACGP